MRKNKVQSDLKREDLKTRTAKLSVKSIKIIFQQYYVFGLLWRLCHYCYSVA